MSETPEHSQQERALTPEEEKEFEAIDKKFNEHTDLGDTYYLYQSWSAWSVIPTRKTIAPVSRIVVGDAYGNVVFNRSVVLTAVVDLMNELAGTFLNEVTKARDMSGFALNLPKEPAAMLDDLRSVSERISAALEILEHSDLLKAAE